MILFILGDLVTSNTGLMHRNTDVIGEIAGTKVHYQDFERKVETLTENYKSNTKNENIDQNTQDMLREQAWGMFVNDNVLTPEYEKIGISCSAEELYDMCVGKNPNAQVKQAFTDPKTGQFDPNAVLRFLKDLPNRDETVQRQWRTFEDAIREERIAEKYKNLIKDGLFASSEEAKRNHEEIFNTKTIRFVRLDYNTIPDSTVKFEDSDLEKYYSDNNSKYKQAENIRKIEYITWEVLPSSDDKEEVKKWIDSKKGEFESSTNDILFVNQNSDNPFDSAFHAKGTLKPELDSVMFNSNIGTIVGPYLDGESMKLAKLAEVKMVSDSVKARHILLKFENGDTAAALAKADSLKNVIEKGGKFDVLAPIFSGDPGSAVKGGDLGWFRQGMMVQPFNDACFNGKKGDMAIVTSQFGVHLIEIMDKGVPSKQVQVAIVERKIEPSQKTYDNIYNKAMEFASKNPDAPSFESSIVKQGLNKRIADNIRENDKNILGLDQPRELVRWAFTAKKDDISKVFTFGDKYAIARLTEIREKGTLPLDLVKDQVTAEVRKIKKADILIEKFNKASGTTIDEIAQKLNTTATDADNVTFANNYIPGIGNEPAVVGTIYNAKANQITKPIKGDNGVAVVYIVSVKEAPPITDIPGNKKQITDQRKSRSDYEVFNALKEKANIDDNRGRFY